jgi:hypothetical protein
VAIIVVDARFNGPPHSANGGYLSGLLSAFVDAGGAAEVTAVEVAAVGVAAVEVTLRSPPPLGVPLDVVLSEGEADLRDGDTLLAHARGAQLHGTPPAFVPAATAREAASRYAGLQMHPFPGCFVCGLDRDDGMALQPGPVSADTVAAYWQPDASLATGGAIGWEFAWAALDCPGGWATDLGGRPMVLGRMTAQVTGVPAVGQPCVVVGEARGGEGRKAFTASALYTTDAEVLGYAEATWIAIDPAVLRPARSGRGVRPGREALD